MTVCVQPSSCTNFITFMAMGTLDIKSIPLKTSPRKEVKELFHTLPLLLFKVLITLDLVDAWIRRGWSLLFITFLTY